MTSWLRRAGASPTHHPPMKGRDAGQGGAGQAEGDLAFQYPERIRRRAFRQQLPAEKRRTLEGRGVRGTLGSVVSRRPFWVHEFGGFMSVLCCLHL